MPTILFCPSLAGLAHVIRCLATAERLTNCICIIIVEPGHRKFILSNYKPPKHITFMEHSAEFYNDTAFWRQAMKNKIPPDTLKSEIYYYIDITKKIKPDLVVSDSNLFSAMAAKVLGVPCTLLSVMTLLPYHRRVIKLTNFKTLQKGFDAVFSSLANNKIISLVDKAFLASYRREGLPNTSHSAKQVLDDFDKILFDDPKATTLSPSTPNVKYLPLPIAQIEIGQPEIFEKLKTLTHGKRVAYINLGGTSFNPKLAKALIKAFLAEGYFVLCSTVFDISRKELPDSAMLYSDSFTPGYLMAALADVMVTHGSQGTIAQAIETKTPLFAIPFHADQYLMLNIQTNPLIKSVMPINLRLIARLWAEPTSLLKLPSKLNIPSLVAMANKIPSKPASLKRMPRAKQDQALVDHLMAKIANNK